MKLILIRHGDTDYTINNRLCGVIDAPLNKRGIAQARRLGRRLSRIKNKIIYCSPLGRTVATARIIAGDHRRLIKCKELVESNLGRWEGLTFDQIREQFPQAMKRWVKSPMTFNAPKGEKLKSLQKRVRRFLKRVGSDNHSRKTVIVVTHSGPIRVILGEAKGRGLKDFWTTEPKTGCCLKVNLCKESF